MENKNINTAEQTVSETTAEAASQNVAETVETEAPRKKVYRDQDFYPYCAIIICICAAVGQLIGKYVLPNPKMGLTAGMIIGIIIAIVYVAKGGKQIDTSPTKARKKKEKKS